jgi:hypothetical protein
MESSEGKNNGLASEEMREMQNLHVEEGCLFTLWGKDSGASPPEILA